MVWGVIGHEILGIYYNVNKILSKSILHSTRATCCEALLKTDHETTLKMSMLDIILGQVS